MLLQLWVDGFDPEPSNMWVSLSLTQITQEVGSGLFADFSSVQFVNISGMINSLDPSAGTITYRQEMIYKFSCRYPLQYLVNNTEMTVWVTQATFSLRFTSSELSQFREGLPQ